MSAHNQDNQDGQELEELQDDSRPAELPPLDPPEDETSTVEPEPDELEGATSAVEQPQIPDLTQELPEVAVSEATDWPEAIDLPELDVSQGTPTQDEYLSQLNAGTSEGDFPTVQPPEQDNSLVDAVRQLEQRVEELEAKIDTESEPARVTLMDQLRRDIEHDTSLSVFGAADGVEVIQTPSGVSLANRQRPCMRGQLMRSGKRFLWGHITGSAAIPGRDNAYHYSWVEVVPNENGQFTAPANPRSDATHGYAYNTLEAYNTATGVQGSGHNVSGLPAGITLLPIGPGVVPMWLDYDCNGNLRPYFSVGNGVGGSC